MIFILFMAFLELCSAHPLYIDKSQANCINPRIRKEWRELSDAEKSNFFKSINALKNASSIMNATNRYEDFTLLHFSIASRVHNNVT